jgi:hypothetical protein
MSTNPAAQSGDMGNSPLRMPLSPRAVSPTPPIQKQIRRKHSFVLRGDSSEEIPSPHDSIFEAYYFSAANSEESSHKIELVSISKHDIPGATVDSGGNDENSRQLTTPANPCFVDDIEFRYGHGTVLETITEQKSCNTIRETARTKSADDLPKFPSLTHRDSFVLAKTPRRKHSFSVDDLALIKQNYHEACAMIEREIRKPLPVHKIYAQPKNPIHPPVYRPPTPPGMPSWTAAQNLSPRVRGTHNQPSVQNRLQRFLHLPASGITLSSRVPAANLTRSVSAPLHARIAPRFRPPRSVYGPIDRHPFLNAPVAKVVELPPTAPPADPASGGARTGSRLPKPSGKRKLGQRVRFTPSATARDSEMMSLQAAIVSTTAAAVHPLAPVEATPIDTRSLTALPHCPHRKGRREALKVHKISLNHHGSLPPSNEYLPLPVQSPPREDSTSRCLSPLPSPTNPFSLASSRNNSLNTVDSGIFDSQPSCTTSFSSTTHLMTGALRPISPTPDSEYFRTSYTREPENSFPQKEPWCWKCNVEKVFAKMDQMWMQSAGCFCIVCCGVDLDDDMSLSRGNGLTSSVHHNVPGRRFGQEVVGPRRVILDETPAGTL